MNAPLAPVGPAPIRAVLFDKDGTLFGFQETWGPWAVRLLRGLARDGAQAEALAAALRFDLAAARFAPDSPAVAGTLAEQVALLLPLLPGWDADGLREHLSRTAAEAVPVPAADLVPLLTGLRARGLGIGIATNDGAHPARRHLEGAGLTGLVDWLAGYDSGHGAKPAPGMLLAYARAAGVDPAEVAMVGDSLHDLHAARAAGMVAVGVLTGTAGRAELAPHADVVLDSVAALPDWLDARAAAQRAVAGR